MSKKVFYSMVLAITASLLWYFFLKPYDYLASFKIKTSAGVINQSIKKWGLKLDNSSEIGQKGLRNLSHQLVFNDSVDRYRWEIVAENDSISQVRVKVKTIDHSLKNRLSMPFGNTCFEKRTKSTILGFNEYLKDHLKEFKVSISGLDTLASAYCAYVPIKSTQSQKAKGMMRNYSLLSDFIAANRIKLAGTPIIEIEKWDRTTDSIYYNFCYPIIKSDSLPKSDYIKYKQLEERPALKAIYNGNYITSDRSWYSLLDYGEINEIELIPEPIEVFFNNPNMGDNALQWKTEVYMPLKIGKIQSQK